MRSAFAGLAILAMSLAIIACGTPAQESPLSCLSGTECDGECVQLTTDNAHCGACGSACAEGEVCAGGRCAASCAAPLTTCGLGAAMWCADLRSDPTSCGSCGEACADGQLCAEGRCVEACSAPLSVCGDGTTRRCVDLRFDPSYCGSCGVACAPGSICSAGVCGPACSAPLTACGTGAGGVCADLRSDPAHCGACDLTCPTGQQCQAGACGPSCSAPLTVCGTGDDARCVDLRSDVTSCGSCGRACEAGEACLAGACSATCEGAGGTLCDGTCVDLATDNANCGACENECSQGTACDEGACAATCPPGQIPCGGICLDPSADPDNCGVCGNVCATGICRAGECSAAACEGTIGLPGRPMPSPSTAVGQPEDHALADLDGDGVLDLAMPRHDTDVIEIRHVRTPGLLGPPVHIAVPDGPTGIAAGDVDGDGRPDLVACSSGGTGAITLLRNRGDGAFDRSDFPANGVATHCALGDLDGDGRPDLALSYTDHARIAVARNTGGAFAVPLPYPSAKPFPRNVTIADLDRDGNLDVIVLNRPLSINEGWPDIDKGSVSVYPGAGDGSLGAPTTYASGVVGNDMVIADLDADGELDVATAAFVDDAIAVLLNDGHGALLPRISVPVGSAPISVAAGDLDGDGSIDLAVNRYYDDVAILRNDGHAGFAALEAYAIVSEELALADANHDGALDLLVAAARPQLVLQEAGRLVAPTPLLGAGDHVVLADVDGDGRLDAIAGSGIQRGRPDGSFAPPERFAPSSVSDVAAGDIDGDGDVDLAYSDFSTFVRRNQGDGTFGPEEQLRRSAGESSSTLTLGDLDGDGDLDLAVAHGFRASGSVRVYWNVGGVFQFGPRLVTGWDSRRPVIGRLTGNALPDLLVPNWMDGTVSVFQGHVYRTFTLYATLRVPLHSASALIADVTQDGRADLVATGPGDLSHLLNPEVRIYPGLDRGLGEPIDLPTKAYPLEVAVGDLDSDGRPDLIVVGAGLAAFHRALPGGGFEPSSLYAAPTSEGVAVHDVNGDLRPDLVIVGDHLITLINRCYAE